MRRNRRVSRKQSVMGMHAMHLGVIILTLLATVIVNQCASASCDRLMNKIGEKERILKRKDAELSRVKARWDAVKSSDGLRRALDARGVEMAAARPDHIIRISSSGAYDRRQRSVSLVRKRFSSVARVETLPSPSRRTTLRR